MLCGTGMTLTVSGGDRSDSSSSGASLLYGHGILLLYQVYIRMFQWVKHKRQKYFFLKTVVFSKTPGWDTHYSQAEPQVLFREVQRLHQSGLSDCVSSCPQVVPAFGLRHMSQLNHNRNKHTWLLYTHRLRTWRQGAGSLYSGYQSTTSKSYTETGRQKYSFWCVHFNLFSRPGEMVTNMKARQSTAVSRDMRSMVC